MLFYGWKKNVYLRAATFLSSFLLFVACNEIKSDSPKLPTRPASASKSSISGSGGEVGVRHTVTVRLLDSSNNPINRVTPSITALDSGGANTGIVGVCNASNSSGYASCSISSVTAGTYTLKMTYPVAVMGNSITFTQVARQLSFSTEPACSTSCASLSNLTTQPVVRVLDRVGNLMTSDNTTAVTVALTTANGATLNGVTTVTAVAGVATFAGLDVDLAGSYTMTATATGLSSATSATAFTITHGAADHLDFDTQPSTVTASGVAFVQQPKIRIEDASGNLVTGNSTCVVTMSLTTSPATGTHTLLGTVSKSASSGIVDFSGLNLRVSSTTGGTDAFRLTATAASCSLTTTTDVSDLFSITLAGTPYQLSLATPPSQAALNETWSTQPVLHVLDVDGNLVTGDNTTVVTIARVGAAPTGSISGSTSITASGGIVRFTNLLVSGTAAGDAGTFTWRFSATNPNVASIQSTDITQVITPDGITPAALRFDVQPTNTSVNATMAEIKVKVVDANGYLCTAATDSVDLNLYYGAGVMTGTLTKVAVNGIATFDNIVINTSGQKQLSASSTVVGALTTAYSNVFTVASFGTPNKVAFTTEPNRTAANWPAEWDQQPVVAVQDQYGRTVTTDNSTVVTLTCVNPSGCSLLGTTSVQVVNGVATFDGIRANSAALTGVTVEATGVNAGTTYIKAQSQSFAAP